MSGMAWIISVALLVMVIFYPYWLVSCLKTKPSMTAGRVTFSTDVMTPEVLLKI